MTIGLVGRKSGMTRVFTEDGASIPVTVVEVSPNRVTQIKELDSDGYRAIQVTAGNRKASRVSKSAAGQFAKAGVEAGRGLWEFRLGDADEAPEVGSELTVERFEAGQKVDVAGKSKGKGFQGGDQALELHHAGRHPRQLTVAPCPGFYRPVPNPGSCLKGKKMAGHMGAENVTTQGLEVVRVDVERNLLLIKGAVPGAPGGDVFVRPAVKA